MEKGRLGWRSVITGLGVGASVLSLGCEGGSASAGSEGDTINLARCFGADCGTRVQASQGTSSEAEPCGDVQGSLEDPVKFEAVEGVTLESLHLSPDGSVWVLGRTDNFSNSTQAPALLHYSADGELLGNSGPLQAEGAHVLTQQAVAIDPDGNVTVPVYSVYAPTADSELVERLNVYSFDADFNPVGEPLALRGVGWAQVVSPAVGTLVLAANALNNAQHGVLARLTDGEPDWIQTGVPSAGTTTVGVSGLVVAEDGTTTVLTQRTPRWDGSPGPYNYKYGVATFDVNGEPVSDLELPTPYDNGSTGGIAALPDGDFVVAGTTDLEHTMLRRVSRQGELGWAFEVFGPAWPYLAVDPETGRSFTTTGAGLAVIEPDGVSCHQLSVPVEPGSIIVVQAPQVRGDYVYMLDGWNVYRYRIPSE